ncbi:oxygen-independent coproporphyrinogen III oxidase [Maritalea mediterranea]|uniref:Coproporphyrinogen-III oxidase n=1 Tax=Maritalea mediterranea TaxID=2909667 RepID=A0ABS9E8A1_9HYPH|nr:oxygen-independent coproporphyrinogen III oxidase [Maritalea mediterranea]MCF4099113.1 oxygen-independent coproporphyrinogen III oxidase [Maritalea mediterranea]
MDHALIEKYAAPVPRYTSYPTAPHFSDEVNNAVYAEWLNGFRVGDQLSLYIHIPFCDRLCWFCGCNTKQTLKYAPVQAYLKRLYKEIEMVAAKLPHRLRVVSLHLGGGSPTLLQADDFARLKDVLRTHFDFADDAEISIEIDPSDVTSEQIKGMVDFGLTRASIGVQDFSDVVQKAINRPQSFEITRDVVEALRAQGIKSINLDVLYGLPHQTTERLMDTVAKTAFLQPDRIALFGYAHVPWMKTHQKMIDEAALPGTDERFEHAMLAADALVDAGYERVGFDHFALPQDKMAVAARNGTLRRNFQGYTVDPADAMIGFGGSAIGQNRDGYIQNVVPTGQYQAMIDKGELAVGKGYALTEEDRMRGHVIEQLMCQFSFDKIELVARYGDAAKAILREANLIAAQHQDGFIENDEHRFAVVGHGKPFVRAIAAKFDAYFGRGTARHSKAV